jgi:hypothetical protein
VLQVAQAPKQLQEQRLLHVEPQELPRLAVQATVHQAAEVTSLVAEAEARQVVGASAA